jgi:hypothetical protein
MQVNNLDIFLLVINIYKVVFWYVIGKIIRKNQFSSLIQNVALVWSKFLKVIEGNTIEKNKKF